MVEAKRAIARALPPRLRRRLARAAGYAVPEPIDLGRLELIRASSIDDLRDPDYLSGDLLPRLGINAMAHLLPPELHSAAGTGLRLSQYPIQFGPYLAALADQGIRSYVEVGVEHGGTFAVTVEYLSRFTPLTRALAVDINHVPSLPAFAAANPAVELRIVDSHAPEFARLLDQHGPWDLALIDADHAEEACRRDFATLRDRARRIALHDIVDTPSPGVGRVWQEVREREDGRFAVREFTAQYPDVEARQGATFLGIGLATAR